MTEEMSKKVIEFTRDYYRYSLRSEDDCCIERFVNYDEKFPKSLINKILNSKNPMETFDLEIMDLECQCDDWCYEDNFFNNLSDFCNENNIDEYEARDIVYETFYWSYSESFLNPTINTVWTIQCGDMNHDFVLHNLLNYDKGVYTDGFEKEAGLYWLAKQQGHLTELKLAIDEKSPKHFYSSSDLIIKLLVALENETRRLGRIYVYDKNSQIVSRLKRCEEILRKIDCLKWFMNRDGEDDPYVYSSLIELCEELDVSTFEYIQSKFTKTCITELENCTSYMTALTFLVKMPLLDAVNILEKVNEMEKSKDFNEYYPLETKGMPFGYITLGKETNVGLYDSCQGGGSLLEIQLEKDVKLPLQFLWRITDDNEIQNVYGMVDECWQSSIKEINLKEIA